MYCNQCGKSNPDNALFCSYCGEKLNCISTETPAATPSLKPPSKNNPVDSSDFFYSSTRSLPAQQSSVLPWKKSMFFTFVAWAVCAVLLFCNWFSVDLYFAEVKFSVFSLNKATSALIGDDAYDFGDSLEILNIFTIVSSVLFLLSLAMTIFLFIKKKKGMFATGIILSLLLIIFTAIVMIAYFSATGGDDLSGLIVNAALKMTAVPYILLGFAAFSIITLLISLSEFRKFAPMEEKVERQSHNLFEKAKQKAPEFTAKARQCFSDFLKNVKTVFQKIVSSKIFIPVIIIAIVLIIVIVVVSGMACAPKNNLDEYSSEIEYTFYYDDVDYLESDNDGINIDEKTLREVIPVIDKFVEAENADDYLAFASLYNEDVLNLDLYTKYSDTSYYYSWAESLEYRDGLGFLHDYYSGINPYAWSIKNADYTFLSDVFIRCRDAGINITNALGLTLVYSFDDDDESDSNYILYDYNGEEFVSPNFCVSNIELIKIDSEWYLAYGLYAPSQVLDGSTLEHYENLFWDCVYSDLSEEDDHEYILVGEDTYFDDIEFINSYDTAWGIDYNSYTEIVPIIEQYVIALKNNDLTGVARLYSDKVLQYRINNDPDGFKYDNWEDILRNRHDSCWYVNYENLDYLGSDIAVGEISYVDAVLFSADEIDYVRNETGIDQRGYAAIYVNLNISDIYYEDALYFELCKIGAEWYIVE